MRNSKEGMTFVEILIAAFFTIVLVTALIGVFAISMRLVQQAREVSIATDDLKDVMEKIKSVSYSGVASEFPDGSSVPAGSVGGLLLDDENIVVSYPNGTGVDPMLIQVTVSWTSRDVGARSESFRTIKTSY